MAEKANFGEPGGLQMRFYLIDESPSVINVLRTIIHEQSLGQVCGSTVDTVDALEDLEHIKPDIILVDLMMPKMDGITFVKKAKEILSDTIYVMLSQTTSKELIAEAYESGAEIVIQKPVNSIEVTHVLRKVIRSLNMMRTFLQMQELLDKINPVGEFTGKVRFSKQDEVRERVEDLLRKIGILGESGSRDIVALIGHLSDHPDDIVLPLDKLCAKVGDTPKTIEQRMRRAAYAGLTSLASLGVEDYANDIFMEYAGSLYQFEQVRREMDYIRGKSDHHGKVQIKTFLSALLSYSTRKEYII